MGIESMNAASAANIVQPSQQPQQTEQAAIKSVDVKMRNDHFLEQAKETQKVSAEKLDAAIDRLNEMMKSSQRSLNFSVDRSSEKVVVQVRDTSTDTVVRQIPNEEAIKFAESFDRLMGLIFDKKA